MIETSVTVEILKSIRTEVQNTNARLDQMNARLEQTNTNLGGLAARVDQLGHDLGRRIVESEIRTATAITDLAGTVRELTSTLKAQADLRPRVEKCEVEIAELKRKATGG